MDIKLKLPACISDGDAGYVREVVHSTSASYGSIIQHSLWKHTAYALCGMGTFWRCSSGGSIWMVQALEPSEEYKAARDGMKVMAVMLLLLLVVGVRAVIRMFLSKHTCTSTIVQRVRSWRDTYQLCSQFRSRMRAIALYPSNSLRESPGPADANCLYSKLGTWDSP